MIPSETANSNFQAQQLPLLINLQHGMGTSFKVYVANIRVNSA